MKELILEGAKWNTPEDGYDSFFNSVGAPSWPDRDFNALHDGISGEPINQIEVSCRLVIQNYDSKARKREKWSTIASI